MELGEAAYPASTDGRAQYHIDTGISNHFIEAIGALHDYGSFEPRTTTTAENGTMQACGTHPDGKEMKECLPHT